ncbi:MAG TPA: iron-sulfur cluster assembly protein, partial [Phototrophicaceae bacterium]|nr:iron-sulfur cluster assembly protein [Phototrophicaceae bacterium]
MSAPTVEAIRSELEKVLDPEIRRPITELGMVRSVEVAADGDVVVGIDLTTAGCPLRTTITNDVTAAAQRVEGVSDVRVDMGVMSEEQRKALRSQLRGGVAEPTIPFSEPGNLTRVYAVTSGKGGVGKSSVTANLAAS